MSVVIDVPPSRPTLIRRPQGDPDTADSFADTLYTASTRFEAVADESETVTMIFGFSGDSEVAYREASTRVGGEHRSMSETVERVGRAVTAYADTLRDLQQDADDLRELKASLDDRRRTLIADIEATEEATEDTVYALRERATDLRIDYAELVTADDDLQRRVLAAESLLRQSFVAGTSLTQALSEDGGVPPIAQYAMDRPGAPGTGASPEEVNAWWEGLSEAQQEAVTAAYPSLVGSADGVPAGARDDANRVQLDNDLGTLEAKEDDGTITPEEEEVLANAREAEQALADADGFEDPITGDRPGGQLYLYDPGAFDGDGAVAIGVGDLDTATDVAVFTPGINTDMSDTTGYVGDMTNLYESTRYNGDGSSVATMFWLGYDAPDGVTDGATMTEGRAEDGGRRLADMVDGMRATRPDDPAHLTAIGHSYGSTATSYAAGDFDLDVDDLVLIGSPGTGPAGDAGDFSVDRDHVYVGRDSRDGVAFLGDEGWAGKPWVGLGNDPSSEDFGATRFEAESTDRPWYPNFGDSHGSYLDPDSESLYNLGLIVGGDGDDVNEAEQTYDPFLGEPEDPEWTREPSSGLEGESRTRDEE